MAVAAPLPLAYSRATSVLHWASAVTIFAAVGTVLKAQGTADKAEKADLMHKHKSMGLLTGGLLVLRLAAAALTRRPGPLPGADALERAAGHAGHLALYGFTIVMAGTGVAMGYFGGGGLPFFSTRFAGAAQPDRSVAGPAYNVHKFVGHWGKFLIPLHVGAAGLHAVRGHPIFARINPFGASGTLQGFR